MTGAAHEAAVHDRSAWDDAFARLACAAAQDEAFDVIYERLGDAEKKSLEDVWDGLGEARYNAGWALFQIPAPDRRALLWKIERLFGGAADDNQASTDWSPAILKTFMADARRILGRSPQHGRGQ